jgi:hypothetical protein
MFVVPKPAVLAEIVLVVCRICCSHGYSPNQGTPPIVSRDATMNQVGGEFKTKIGNVRKMTIAAAKQINKKICRRVLSMLAKLR